MKINILQWLLIVTSVLVSLSCNNPGNSASNASHGNQVTIAIQAAAQASSTYKLTVTGSDMEAIGPNDYAGGQTIELYIPEGPQRLFYLERYDSTGILSDTGSVQIDIGSGMNTISSAMITIALKSTLQSYSVTFDGNGNTGGTIPATQTKSRNTTLTLAANVGELTKTGYSFAGWNTKPEGTGTDYVENADYTEDADVTLYAKWIANVYTVTFAKNDTNATGVMDSQNISFGSALPLTSNTFEKAGWEFAGWAPSPTGPVTYTDGATYTMGAENITLFAQWTANKYSVTFDKNDPVATGSMASQIVASGSSALLTSNTFEKAGWEFTGWAISPTGPVTYTDGATYTMGAENITLFAQWAANEYSVTFDKNDPLATGSMDPQTVASGSSAPLTSCTFRKAGWEFAGWAASPTGPISLADGATYTMGVENITLYAIWTANEYSVVFNKNDPEAFGTMKPQIIASGSSAPLTSCAFEKIGWEFAGWAASPAGPVTFLNGDNYTMGVGNSTLYARWTAIEYTVTFDKNDPGATGTMQPQTIASGSSAPLTSCTYEKTGWRFDGWAITPTGPITFLNRADYTMDVGNITLYARWSAINYSITFNQNDFYVSGSMSKQIIPCGSTAPLDSFAFTKDGWVFMGWATSPSNPVVYENGAEFTMGTSDVTLYARWAKKYELMSTGPGGGTVFYDKGYYSDGWRYMEVAPPETDTTGIEWGAYGTPILTDIGVNLCMEIGYGKINTEAIVAWLNTNGETGRAAQYCDNLVYGSKNDWFLPSSNELIEIHNAFGQGIFADVSYWSSSEFSGEWARVVNFSHTPPRGIAIDKNTKYYRIRAVRYF